MCSLGNPIALKFAAFVRNSWTGEPGPAPEVTRMTRVAFYTRISTDDDRQKFSLAAQRERLEAHCKAQYGDDWTLAGVYSDQESGSQTRRPELDRLFADARAHRFDVVLVFKVDRL